MVALGSFGWGAGFIREGDVDHQIFMRNNVSQEFAVLRSDGTWSLVPGNGIDIRKTDKNGDG